MSGYIGAIPVPEATQKRSSHTATSGQTTFAVDYTVGFIDVFLNGIKLANQDFTATNGNSVTLAVAASANDILDTISYTTFNVADPSHVSAGAVNLLEYEYTATAGQTTFTGADNNSATLSYSVGNIIVSLNGITLDNGSDFTPVGGTSIVLASGAAAGDHLAIIAFTRNFYVADVVSATTGGTFGGSVSVTGQVNATTGGTFGGGLTVAGNVSLPDNYKALFGAGSDLQIYHNGSASYISEQGTGNLVLGAADSIIFQNAAHDENMLVASQNGAVSLYYDNAVKLATTATGISVTGGITVDSTSSFEEIKEKVSVDSSTTGTITHALATGPAIVFCNVDQTANRTVNLTGANTFLDTGQSTTVVILFKQGSTAYYPNAFQIDGAAVTPEWQGGSAPTDGNANSIDSYSYTIIKTASSTYTVLASKTQFA